MKFLLIVLSLSIISVSEIHEEPSQDGDRLQNYSGIETKYIRQYVDHFAEKYNLMTWKMRYFVSAKHFKSRQPIFILVGGDWAITPKLLKTGHLHDIAGLTGAFIIYIEHRYYGESQPLRELTVENMKYLTVKQAMADLSHFINTIKSENLQLRTSKIILVGAGYGGSLAVWFKKLHPALVDGVWASSAPLEFNVDFKEYREVVGTSIRTVCGQRAYDRIQNAIKTFEEKVFKNEMEVVRHHISICQNFDPANSKDVMTMFKSIGYMFSKLIGQNTSETIAQKCEEIMLPSDELAGVGNYINSFLGNAECFDFTYAHTLQNLKNISTHQSGLLAQQLKKILTTKGFYKERQWFYRQCSEFGSFPTTTSEQQPFGLHIPLEYFLDLCQDTFGPMFNLSYIQERLEKINSLFDGKNIQLDKAYFTHGELDPLYAEGRVCADDCGGVARFYTFARDLEPTNHRDTCEMAGIKHTAYSLIVQWIQRNDTDTKMRSISFISARISTFLIISCSINLKVL